MARLVGAVEGLLQIIAGLFVGLVVAGLLQIMGGLVGIAVEGLLQIVGRLMGAVLFRAVEGGLGGLGLIKGGLSRVMVG